MCVCMCKCMHAHATAYVQKSEDSFGELDLSLYYVGSRYQTQAIRLGGIHPYLLNLLTGHKVVFFNSHNLPFINSIITNFYEASFILILALCLDLQKTVKICTSLTQETGWRRGERKEIDLYSLHHLIHISHLQEAFQTAQKPEENITYRRICVCGYQITQARRACSVFLLAGNISLLFRSVTAKVMTCWEKFCFLQKATYL